MKSIYLRCCVLFTATAASLQLGMAQSVAQKVTKGPLQNEGVLPLNSIVRHGKLANGLTYYVQKNTEPQNRVYFYLVNKVGSVLETDAQQGLAHYMEHMNFNGTTHYPKNDLVEYLQKAGVRFGADLNAYTGFNETIYMLPIPSDKPELVKGGLQIVRDWAHGALLEKDEIDKERGVILEEERMGQGAAERMRNKYLPMLFNHSRYSLRMPIGKDSILKNFKPQTIKDFYNDWYRPDLQAVIIVGDIDPAATEAEVKRLFSDLKNPVSEKQRVNYKIPLTGKNQFMAITDAENSQSSIQIFFKHPVQPLRTKADLRARILSTMVNQMLQARLAEGLKVADPPYLSAAAGNTGLESNLETFTCSVNAKPGELERGFKAMWTGVETARRYGFTQTELQRAKESYQKAVESSWKEKDKTSSDKYIDEYVSHFLHEEASPGIDAEYKLTQELLPGITTAEVNQVLNRYFSDQNRDILVMGPEQSQGKLPDETKVLDWMKSVEKGTLTAYADDVKDQPLMAVKPTPGKVVSRKTIGNIGVTELTFSNGVKVVLKPTTFNNDQIIFSAYCPGGSSLIGDSDYMSAANAGAIVVASGLGDINSIQLPKLLSNKTVRVIPSIGERTENINGQSSPQDLETALQLTYLYFTHPRQDSAVFNGIISRVKSSLANRANDPNAVFADTVNAVLSSSNFRRTGPTINKINQINLQKAYSIYKDRFADASDFTFMFVGNFDIDKITPMLELYIGSLPGAGRKEKPKDLGIRIPAGEISKTVRKGSADKATVYMVMSGQYEFNAANNLKLDALKQIIEFRLLERLREAEGGVYSPGVSVSYGKFPVATYAFMINFNCAPDNQDKMINDALEEVEKIGKNGPTETEVQKVIAEDRNSNEAALKTNAFWLNYINNQYQNNENPEHVLRYNTELENLTVGEIKAAAKQYLSKENLIKLSLMPEPKSGL